MKRAAFLGGVLALVAAAGVYVYFNDGTITVTNEMTKTVEKVVEVEKEVPSDEMRIGAAQEAARAEVEAKAQAAYDDMYELEMNKIEAEVLLEIENEIKTRRLETEQKIGAY